MSSFVTIGHELWIILTVRTTYHFLVCSTFHRSIMKDTNTTVGYPYTYHYCTYVQCFFLLSCDISLLHTRHYISLKRVHTIELLLSGRILISNGYLLFVIGELYFWKSTWLQNCHMWSVYSTVFLSAKGDVHDFLFRFFW